MNEKIKQHVAAYNAKNGYGTSDEDIIEIILDSVVIWSGDEDRRRWWTTEFCVTNIDGMLIGYEGATTTGDDSPRDKGWEFDPETICEVEAKEVTVIEYSPKGD